MRVGRCEESEGSEGGWRRGNEGVGKEGGVRVRVMGEEGS